MAEWMPISKSYGVIAKQDHNKKAKIVKKVFLRENNCCRNWTFWGRIKDEWNLNLFLLKLFMC